MPVVTLDLPAPAPHRYDIVIEPGALSRLGDLLKDVAPHNRAGLFADARVLDLHGEAARASLTDAGYQPAVHGFAAGEDRKRLATAAELYDVAAEHHLERKSPIVALGGGVAGDLVGMVAATWLRGVPFVQCPTTLLAMVDASVGGKTGVNLDAGKNLVGAFHQPVLVIADTDTLATLDDRQLRCGLAECVKHAVIRDADLFDWIENRGDALLNRDDAALVELIERNVRIKAAVVAEDEKESGVRAHLNFGHTFAHAIEAICGYGQFTHGEAVALGMVAATHLAADEGRIESTLTDRLTALLDRLGLPTAADDLPPADKLLEAMRLDKKVAGDRIRLVLPTRLGAVTLDDNVADDVILEAWNRIRG
ncbi:MAG: 3-dehydroquinate synthase [Phycisphaeraceae bacterium]|nr:3-dehydroquinate synthase [Phycisphaeraceae bacterium]